MAYEDIVPDAKYLKLAPLGEPPALSEPANRALRPRGRPYAASPHFFGSHDNNDEIKTPNNVSNGSKL
jgi:hypothetical protein